MSFFDRHETLVEILCGAAYVLYGFFIWWVIEKLVPSNSGAFLRWLTYVVLFFLPLAVGFWVHSLVRKKKRQKEEAEKEMDELKKRIARLENREK